MHSSDKLDDSFLQALVGASSTKLKSREQKLPKLTNSSSTGASMSEAHCNVDVSWTKTCEHILAKNSSKDAVNSPEFCACTENASAQGPTG